MPMPARQSRGRNSHGLLARYSQTLGEMMLRKHTEKAIGAARAEAELNSRSKSAFLGTMSHELRTPLNAIIGFSDLIRQPGATTADQSAEYAQHIFNAGRRLLAVFSDVLDISKLESGSLTLERRPCPTGEILEAAANAMRETFAQKSQQFELRAEPGLPVIQADPVRLKQALANLLSNAGKFAPPGGRIVLAAAPAPGGVAIAVSDDGPGMTQDQIHTALTPFAQLQSHFNRAHEGTGLGLPLAQGLAQLHGGTLCIDSKPGGGTTVIITLPAGEDSKGAA